MGKVRRELAEALWELSEAVFSDWTGKMIAIAQAHDLSMGELNTLYELSSAGPLNLSEIAKRVGLSKAAASQMVERMVQDGLLERRESPHSRREKLVRLTPKAQAINRNFDEAVLGEMEGVFGRVPDGPLERLREALGEVLRHLPTSEERGEP